MPKNRMITAKELTERIWNMVKATCPGHEMPPSEWEEDQAKKEIEKLLENRDREWINGAAQFRKALHEAGLHGHYNLFQQWEWPAPVTDAAFSQPAPAQQERTCPKCDHPISRHVGHCRYTGDCSGRECGCIAQQEGGSNGGRIRR